MKSLLAVGHGKASSDLLAAALAAATLTVSALAACDTSRPPTSSDAPKPAPPQASASGQSEQPEAPAPSKLAERPYRFPAPERLIAIGDLHGDLKSTKAALRLGGAIGPDDHWSGGKLVVVNTGDQLDRGDEEREILDLFERLKVEAARAGGAFHVLNGNHELMNALGDFRYVTPRGFRAFDGVTPRSPLADRFPSEWQGRAGALLPGGHYATVLADRDIVAVVGDTAFTHGGLRPPHVDHGIERLNAEARAFLLGQTTHPPRLVVDPEGPLWTRIYGEGQLDKAACAVLSRTLEKLAVKRLVIGHTVQRDGASSACDERVWRIDVGLSHYYGDGPIQVLEIVREAGEDRVRILSAPRAK